MISCIDQIEDSLKRGYRSAVLGFVKSRISGNVSYFIEITRMAWAPSPDKIFMTKHDYDFAQDLLDKYNEIHRVEKDKEKERKLKAKEDRKLKLNKIKENVEEDDNGDEDEDNNENDDLKFVDGKLIDAKIKISLSEEDTDIIEPNVEDETTELSEDEINVLEKELELYNARKQKGEIDEQI